MSKIKYLFLFILLFIIIGIYTLRFYSDDYIIWTFKHRGQPGPIQIHMDNRVLISVERAVLGLDMDTGRLVWEKGIHTYSPLILLDESIITGCEIEEVIYWFDANTGQNIKVYQIQGNAMVCQLLSEEKVIYAARAADYSSSSLNVLDLTDGTVRLIYQFEEFTQISGPLILYNDVVIVFRNYNYDLRKVYAVSMASGEVIWTKDLKGNTILHESYVLQKNGSLFIIDDRNNALIELDIESGDEIQLIETANIIDSVIYHEGEYILLIEGWDTVLVYNVVTKEKKSLSIVPGMSTFPVFHRDHVIYVSGDKVYSLDINTGYNQEICSTRGIKTWRIVYKDSYLLLVGAKDIELAIANNKPLTYTFLDISGY